MEPGSADDAQALLDAVFELGPEVRYVAVAEEIDVVMRARGGLVDASSSESDRYEELLVNPTLLTLASRRAAIDIAGGMRYLVIRYGPFFQVVMPRQDGHVSVALEPDADPVAFATRLRELLDGRG